MQPLCNLLSLLAHLFCYSVILLAVQSQHEPLLLTKPGNPKAIVGHLHFLAPWNTPSNYTWFIKSCQVLPLTRQQSTFLHSHCQYSKYHHPQILIFIPLFILALIYSRSSNIPMILHCSMTLHCPALEHFSHTFLSAQNFSLSALYSFKCYSFSCSLIKLPQENLSRYHTSLVEDFKYSIGLHIHNFLFLKFINVCGRHFGSLSTST